MTIAPADRRFTATAALAFLASATVTVAWCQSMAEMEGMAMPGDWIMSMAWMRMGDQTWLDLAATFLGMWIVMMVAMMLPSLVPMLRRYRRAVGPAAPRRLDRLTVTVAAGYFTVWTAVGIAVFVPGIMLAELTMRSAALSQVIPFASGAVVLLAGALQFTAWKERELACCRRGSPHEHRLSADVGAAWRHGLRLGRHCMLSCAGLIAILLVIGVMDLWAMALVMAAITAERLLPAGKRVAQTLGAAVVLSGGYLIMHAIG